MTTLTIGAISFVGEESEPGIVRFVVRTSMDNDVHYMSASEWRSLEAYAAEVGRSREALTKISAIRDSIVGMQGFNFSEHAYPLVAVLDAAGFKGAGYEIARANLGTLIEQIKTCEHERDAYRAMLCDLLASAHPHPTEHPTMTKQWGRARELLKNGPGKP
jgi:hypothetical protein